MKNSQSLMVRGVVGLMAIWSVGPLTAMAGEWQLGLSPADQKVVQQAHELMNQCVIFPAQVTSEKPARWESFGDAIVRLNVECQAAIQMHPDYLDRGVTVITLGQPGHFDAAEGSFLQVEVREASVDGDTQNYRLSVVKNGQPGQSSVAQLVYDSAAEDDVFAEGDALYGLSRVLGAEVPFFDTVRGQAFEVAHDEIVWK